MPKIRIPYRSGRQVGIGVLLLCAFLVSACGGNRALTVYLRANEGRLERPASVDDRPVQVTIDPGTPAREIGRQLQAAGLITDALLFEAYVSVNGLANRLEAGTFLLAPSMTIPQIAADLQNARAASIRIAIPEGWRVEQIADHLKVRNAFLDTDNGVSPEAHRYGQKSSTGDLTGLDPSRYPFLQERPAGSGLEGYLFPATYEIPTANATAEALLARQLDAFAAQVYPRYQQAVDQGATMMTLYEILTVASIVEREAIVPSERPTIAGVYLNRLQAGIKLDADPTVQYAMGYQADTDQWWKTPVFLEEYSSVNSPYNTYLYVGLPPGPIANPGLDSIHAVLYPDQHDYLYFVALPDGSGRHVFARSYDEHVVNVRTYLGQQ